MSFPFFHLPIPDSWPGRPDSLHCHLDTQDVKSVLLPSLEQTWLGFKGWDGHFQAGAVAVVEVQAWRSHP